MKFFALLVACAAVSPIEKTIELLESLQAKIVKEGEEEAKLYEEFTSFCNDESKETQFEIKTAKSDVERAEAAIADEDAKIGVAETKIEELSTTIATAEKDLASATKIREKENADFTKLEKELMEAISMLERAIAIIEREMAKTGFIQGADSMKKVSDALTAVMDAAMVNLADKAKVQALLQSQTAEDDLELQPAGAPDPAAYKSKSGGIVDTLEDMLEKAKAELADAQKAEMNSKFDYDMLKQKLEDAMKHGTKELDETKAAKAAAEEAKAMGENDLAVAEKAAAEGTKHLNDLQNECMTAATEYGESQHSRQEELTALATAKKILEEKTGGATDREYSFIQLKSSSHAHAGSRSMQVKDSVVAMLQQLATKNGDDAISLLADRVQAASMMGEDPFAKIKGLISEMIEKLEADAAKEASHKAFCDKEMKETKAKKEEKESDLDTLSTKIDKATAKIAKLKEEIATLQEELAAIAKAQAEADEIRAEEAAAWEEAKADYESGVEGVGMALQVLRDYYAEKDESLIQQKHVKATGAAIGMLEVIESDFTKSLADGSAAEAMAVEAYEKLT